MINRFVVTATLATALFCNSAAVVAQDASKKESRRAKTQQASVAEPVFWIDPGDIRSKNLFYGPGGKDESPAAPFKYLSEDKGGTTPKFDVEDAKGEKWRGKLGVEAQSETAASRILWALGFGANINYLIPDTTVAGAHARQKRGRDMIDPNDHVYNLRLQKKPDGMKRVAEWNWRDERFKGRREFNGLRVMMAVLSNWDMKPDNNAVMEDKRSGNSIYEVSDVGATFGKTRKSFSGASSKNNPHEYASHHLVSKVTKTYVDLDFPGAPSFFYFFAFEYGFYFGQWRNHWIGRHIPIEDVRWVTGLLTQLSPEQIRDAFRAAHYTNEDTEKLARALESRIAELKKI